MLNKILTKYIHNWHEDWDDAYEALHKAGKGDTGRNPATNIQ